jgi:hypothetical protein
MVIASARIVRLPDKVIVLSAHIDGSGIAQDKKQQQTAADCAVW